MLVHYLIEALSAAIVLIDKLFVNGGFEASGDLASSGGKGGPGFPELLAGISSEAGQADQIEPAPRIGTGLEAAFIRGLGKRDDRFVIILDINKVFSVKELETTKEAEEGEFSEAV